jgi:hypothetical protein
MNERINLHGTLALVRPDLENDPVHQQGEIGIITYVDRNNDEVYVIFDNGKEGTYQGEALLQFKTPDEVAASPVDNAREMKLKDYKDVYKIGLLFDLGRSADLMKALEIARDNPDIWRDVFVTLAERIEHRQNQLVGR